MSKPDFWRANLIFIYGFLVLLFAFFSFFWNYNYPNSSQWDEVYHIASSEKYLTNSVFMESHPPLGKMFIAVGEKILNPNAPKSQVNPIARLCFSDSDWEKRPEIIDKSSFVKTDQIQGYPDGYSFCGVRLMPVLFAVFSVPLFFFLLFLLIRNLHLAMLFSSLFVFDNAIILQSRAAMVDSIQIFFILLALVYFIFKIEQVLDNLPTPLTDLFPNLKLQKTEKLQEIQKTANLSDKIEIKNQTEVAEVIEIAKTENLDKNQTEVENTNKNINLAKLESSKNSSNSQNQNGKIQNLEILDKNSNSNQTLDKNLQRFPLSRGLGGIFLKPDKYFHRLSWQNYLLLGVFCGLSIITKHNAAIILVLPVAWFLFEVFTNRINLHLLEIWNQFRKQVLITLGIIGTFILILLSIRLYSSLNEQFETVFLDLVFKVLPFLIFALLSGTIGFFVYFRKNIIAKSWIKNLVKIISFCFGLILLYSSVFAIHIASGQKVVTDGNNRDGYYLAGDFYKQKLNQGQMSNPINWPIALWDNWLYMAQYHKGVPNLDLCKRDDNGNLSENGSYPMTWPVMNRTISFRWEWGTKDGSVPKDNKYIRYSYLIGNPLIWAVGLFAIILSLVLIISYIFFGLPLRNRRIFHYILTLTALYLAYMIGVLSVERVMYLYHYLIPLIFSLILVPLLFVYNFGELDFELWNSDNFENTAKNIKTNNLQKNSQSKLTKTEKTEILNIASNATATLDSNSSSSSNLAENPSSNSNSNSDLISNNSKEKATNPDQISDKKLENSTQNSQNSFYTAFQEEINTPHFWHYLAVVCFVLLVFACFAFFSPLTYYQPLSREEFLAREWFKFWQMRVVN